MKNISIAIPTQGALISSIVRLFKTFSEANEHELKRGKPLPFCISLAANAEVVNLYGGRYTLKPGQLLRDISKTDLVLIPALAGNISEGLKNEHRLQQWITNQYENGAAIACLCTSVFLLPHTGLLQNEHCVKKWFVANDFRQQFSQVNLIVEKAVVDAQEIHTNGGAYSFVNEIIEDVAGSEAATNSSTCFQTEFNRECQSLAVITNARQIMQPAGSNENASDVVNELDGTISAEQFAAMLNLHLENSEDQVLYDYLVKANNSSNEIGYGLDLHINDGQGIKNYNNRKVFRQMLGTINKR